MEINLYADTGDHINLVIAGFCCQVEKSVWFQLNDSFI
jgi:hypothetical protein